MAYVEVKSGPTYVKQNINFWSDLPDLILKFEPNDCSYFNEHLSDLRFMQCVKNVLTSTTS